MICISVVDNDGYKMKVLMFCNLHNFQNYSKPTIAMNT